MGNIIAEKVFNFMGTNFSAFLFCVLAISLGVTGILIFIKRLFSPSPLSLQFQSTNRINEIVRAQLQQEVRTRHIVLQRNLNRQMKYKKWLESVSMVVTKENLQSKKCSNVDDDIDVDVEIGKKLSDDTTNSDTCCKANSKASTVTITNGGRRSPPHCCICFENYHIGDKVVWSSNPNCPHVFHEDCILAWLSKMGEGLCPLCRQNFCEQETDEQEEIYVG